MDGMKKERREGGRQETQTGVEEDEESLPEEIARLTTHQRSEIDCVMFLSDSNQFDQNVTL